MNRIYRDISAQNRRAQQGSLSMPSGMNLILASAVVVVGCFFSAVQAGASDNPTEGGEDSACIRSTCFPRRVVNFRRELSLYGLGHYRYFGFSVFSAALYSEDSQSLERGFLGSSPATLRLCYYRELDREDFIESGSVIIGKNPGADQVRIAASLERMNALYEAVTPGDCYQINYSPINGIELLLNGVSRGIISDGEFGRAYLGIWLSDYAFSSSLRESLLTPYVSRKS
ncbi:MAG: hypothetical protein DCC75_05545 [Proteobacteria bacterium]|nr:MAG: hypothetical protein DCC75_05545 [Pseudomonadota bacterium]